MRYKPKPAIEAIVNEQATESIARTTAFGLPALKVSYGTIMLYGISDEAILVIRDQVLWLIHAVAYVELEREAGFLSQEEATPILEGYKRELDGISGSFEFR